VLGRLSCLVCVGLAMSNAMSARAEANCSVDERPVVEVVYPTADVLPENLLRFYIYFSAPMRREAALQHVSLRSAETGDDIPGVFFQSRFDLWSNDGTRLTLLLDPGRVKSGLDSSEDLGRALSAGTTYRLELSGALLGRNGCALVPGYEKSFAVAAADVDIPNLNDWQMKVPASGTLEPLRITLNGPHDHVSMAHRIRVKTDIGDTVQGSIDLGEGETDWHFTPAAPWGDDRYVIRIHPTLEDLAGNRLTGLFDDPTGENRTNQTGSETFELEFWPTAPSKETHL